MADKNLGPSAISDGQSKLNAAGKLLCVLQGVCEAPAAHRLSDLVCATGLAKTSVHRLLNDLIECGFIRHDSDGCYRPDIALKILATKVLSYDGNKSIREILQGLHETVGHTVHFAMLAGDQAVYVEKVEDSRQSIRMASRLGTSLQLHLTAIGKAILAYSTDDFICSYAARTGLPGATQHSITAVDALVDEVKVTRQRGYAIDDQENEELIRCIAVPVFNRDRQPIGGVSVSTIAALTSLHDLVQCAEELNGCAERVSQLLVN